MHATLLMLALLTPAQSDFSPLAKSKIFDDDFQWKATQACVKLICRDGTGSAVIVAVRDQHAYAFTAAHVVGDTVQAEVELFRKDTYPAVAAKRKNVEILARNAAIDAAFLKFPLDPLDQPPPVLPLILPGQRPKRFPVPVLAVGCEDGQSPKCFDSQLRAKRLKPQKNNQISFFWETDNPPQTGRSGGGLLDEKGYLIGICAANQDGLGYYTHTDEIHAWLKTDEATKQLKWLWEGTR